MKKNRFLILIFFLTLIFINSTYAQLDPYYYLNTKGEVYFQFINNKNNSIEELSKIISIDNVRGNIIYAYANEAEFRKFLGLDLEFTVLPHPGDADGVRMTDDISKMKNWDYYPTYDAYVAMMYQFAIDYPDLCTIIDIGNTVNGRKLLFAKISDNVSVREAEPQFMYTSTMHGDETTGYVLMLRLIDYLLTNYGANAKVTDLVNNIEIWINPLANPDGTYHSGNNTVYGATRYNANYVNLNRNFPDPQDGQHPDGNPWQPETIAMMNIAEQNNFVLSANFHGGEEVVNYPWDTWSRLHVDDTWWKFISHQYADTVHAHSSYYMNGFDDGITNGYAWYTIAGGRQDYMTYFQHGREVTIELSDTKLLPTNQLPAHWEYNYRSFLNYMEQTLYGIRGIVTDTQGNPLEAQIKILGHDLDIDESQVYSDPANGDYHRMIYAGTYNVEVSADSHFTQVINSVQVSNLQTTVLDVQLVPINPVPVELINFSANIVNRDVLLSWTTATESNNLSFIVLRKAENSFGDWQEIAYINGNGNSSTPIDYSFTDKNIPVGSYIYRLKQVDYDGSFTYSENIKVEIIGKLSFTLYQNYPNPFNPETSIKFSIPKDDYVKLEIFNLLGEKVADLISNNIKAGSHRVTFSGGGLPSGVYIYSLTAGSFSSKRKMNLIK